MSTIPETLKPITSYVKLANDTESRDAVIAYWLRFYIMQKALKIDSKSPGARLFLNELMNKLEKDKASLKDQETIVDDTAAQAHVENYGSRLFEVADSEDRSGNASLKTVKIYLAASQLFESLAVFGEISEEIAERTKYSKFRAATIMKAIKSGEKPPLPENIDPLDQLPTPPSFSSTTPPSQPEASSSGRPSDLDFPPPVAAVPAPPSDGFRENTSASTGPQVSPLSVDKAIKLCKFAASALMLHDVPAAIENLEDALAILKVAKSE